MQLRLDLDRCQGHGRCYVLAPLVFACDDDGYGFVIADRVPDDLWSQARVGAQNCPEDAIAISAEMDET